MKQLDRKALFQVRHAMEMEKWHWRSEASSDMKREAHAKIVAALEDDAPQGKCVCGKVWCPHCGTIREP